MRPAKNALGQPAGYDRPRPPRTAEEVALERAVMESLRDGKSATKQTQEAAS